MAHIVTPPVDYAGALRSENARLADLARGADPDREIPTCPGWTVRKLLTHVGRGDRWAATIARTTESADIRTVADGRPPGDAEGLDRWLRATPGLLIDAVAAAGPDTPVWTFIGPRPASFWIRRRLHESTVHGADLALALGEPVGLDPVLGADGVSEYLDLVAAREEQPLPEGMTLHLHATDEGLAGEWMITSDGWAPGHGKGDAAVRAPAVDLLLVLLRRIPVEAVTVFGDPAVLTTFLDGTPF